MPGKEQQPKKKKASLSRSSVENGDETRNLELNNKSVSNAAKN